MEKINLRATAWENYYNLPCFTLNFNFLYSRAVHHSFVIRLNFRWQRRRQQQLHLAADNDALAYLHAKCLSNAYTKNVPSNRTCGFSIQVSLYLAFSPLEVRIIFAYSVRFENLMRRNFNWKIIFIFFLHCIADAPESVCARRGTCIWHVNLCSFVKSLVRFE